LQSGKKPDGKAVEHLLFYLKKGKLLGVGQEMSQADNREVPLPTAQLEAVAQ
jgi:hypothetical protein